MPRHKRSLRDLKRKRGKKDSSTPASTGSFDYQMFPHLMEAILDYASRDSLFKLRGVSREMRKAADGRLARHLILHTVDTLQQADNVDEDPPVNFRSPTGQLPMFMGWTNHCEEDMYALPWTDPKTYNFPIETIGPADWHEKYIPSVLYPGEVVDQCTRNYVVRALRIRDLVASHTKVLDLVGPLPLSRLREIFSTLVNTSHLILRFRPDVLGRTTWSPSICALTYGELYIDLAEFMAELFAPLNPGSIDTLVQFINVHNDDNLQVLEDSPHFPFLVCKPRRVVFHFRLDFDLLQLLHTDQQRYGYYFYPSHPHVVVVFQYASCAVREGQDNDFELHPVFERFLEDLAMDEPQSVTFVNVAPLPPQLVGLDRSAGVVEVERRIKEPFAIPPHGTDEVNIIRFLTLEEYATEVGPERLALETDGYLTNFTPVPEPEPMTDISDNSCHAEVDAGGSTTTFGKDAIAPAIDEGRTDEGYI